MKISALSCTRSSFGQGADRRLDRHTAARLDRLTAARLDRLAAARLRRRAPAPFRAKTRLFSAVIAVAACGVLACSDDADPAQQTSVGGSSGSAELDASVRDLPGEGLERTPEFDTESRQLTPIGPRRLVESIDRIRGGISGEASDAGTVEAEPLDGGVG
jgi:hypothetical protein